MGYTTEFQGRFVLSKLPSAPTISELLNVTGEDGDGLAGAPDSYCQWQLNKSCRHIEWDGSEKFYNYVEWLQFILDKWLTPEGITLDGDVTFNGEDSCDCGVIKVVKGKVVKQKCELVPDNIESLLSFKAFVLAHDFGQQILSDWSKSQRG